VEKLKLSAIPDDKAVKLTVELTAAVHRDLVAYGEVLGREMGKPVEPAKLVPAMLARFMSTDRAFLRQVVMSSRDGMLRNRRPSHSCPLGHVVGAASWLHGERVVRVISIDRGAAAPNSYLSKPKSFGVGGVARLQRQDTPD